MSGHSREGFSSSFGFVMAAAGSAVGLGNIWSFPTQTAENGGGAFVLLYFVFALVVAYPILLAEFALGRHARANPVEAYKKIGKSNAFASIGAVSIVAVILILSFYSIIAGAMIAYFVQPLFSLIGADRMAAWVTSESVYSSIFFSSIFFFLTISVVAFGIKNGIEKWSTKLMPALLVMMVILIAYVLTLDGAMEGLKKYLLPDFSKIFDPQLSIAAMGQAFFSLSLGVGSMMVYASYVDAKENLPRLGMMVMLCDLGVAFLAGMIIIPAMYAAAAADAMSIVDGQGNLLSGPDLIFKVLPALFGTMGIMGKGVSVLFFFLMVIASLTSTISMLEVPVSFVIENGNMSRRRAALLVGFVSWIIGVLIIVNFDLLFNATVVMTTQYIQPILGIGICVATGWVMRRSKLLNEVNIQHAGLRNLWIFFIRFLAPLFIFIIIVSA